MHLESTVVIRRAPDEVLGFLEDVSNLPKWDRGVSAVRVTSPGLAGIGSGFDTLAYPRHPGDSPEWGRMSYRISAWDKAARSVVVELTSTTGNARYFKSAAWLTRVEPVPEGSRVCCAVDFTLRARYAFLAPILYAKKGAILADMEALRRVLENSQHQAKDAF